jgi:hypothetical protein
VQESGIVPLLMARCMSLVVQLTEHEDPWFIDSAAQDPASRARLLKVGGGWGA